MMLLLYHHSPYHHHRRKIASIADLSISIIKLFVLFAFNNRCQTWFTCEAKPASLVLLPSPSPSSPFEDPIQHEALHRIAKASRVVNITRQHGGDVFRTNDVSYCNMDTCVGLSSGTAGIYRSEKDTNAKSKVKIDDCKCRCLPHLDTFREDLNICVDDIHECTLAPFVSGSSSEKIPFVFLPLRGQIIHPSKEISFEGMKTPICAVSGAQFLTAIGWSELRNPNDGDVPFRLFRDEGRTFLQWLGEVDLRYKMQGRLILVHLMCRDITPISSDINRFPDIETDRLTKSAHNLFSSCVSFRVVGTPTEISSNVTEVSFQTEATTSSTGITTKEYLIIGASSLILGLIYVASVFLYLRLKKYKSRHSIDGNTMPNSVPKNDPSINDSNVFGNGFHGNNYNRTSQSISGGKDRHGGSGRGLPLNGLVGDDVGIVKNNPLLKHYPHLNDNVGLSSDISNSNSECDDECAISNEVHKNVQGCVLVHMSNNLERRDMIRKECASSPTQESERHPEENVSIVEDITAEDKIENMKAIVNGTRRKLYFNPAYFEPQLLMSPPPAALEFLSKIREVITIAKFKMATKRFQPTLIVIPEEHQLNLTESYGKNSTMDVSITSNITNEKDDDSRRKACAGCPGCSADKSANHLAACKNCGEKRNSIRKWLEGVSKHKSDYVMLDNETGQNSSEGVNKTNGNLKSDDVDHQFGKTVCARAVLSNKTSNSSSCSDSDSNKANSVKNVREMQLSSATPKIISHCLKHDKPVEPMKHMINGMVHSNSENYDIYSKSNIEPAKMIGELDIYNSMSMAGSEIYNNPQFMLNSPAQSLCKRNGKPTRSTRSAHKRVDVQDQYSNGHMLRNKEVVVNINKMPDMLYEAIANNYSKRKLDFGTQSGYSQVNHHLPTPDYDDPRYAPPQSKQMYANILNDGMRVPTPDYNSLARSASLKQYQPDSPIYNRKSSPYLIVDYETDSLERTHVHKMNYNRLTPQSNNSSDMSSQPSPSLSAALPLEEEVEIRNTVYDRVEGFRKDGDIDKANMLLKNRNYQLYEHIAPNSMAREPRIRYNTPFHGSMTIEVEHSPTDTEQSTDSDQFEPDTLDRKPKKLNNETQIDKQSHTNLTNIQRNIYERDNQLHKSIDFLNQSDSNVRHVMDNMPSLPDMKLLNGNNNNNSINNHVVLQSNASFKSNNLQNAFRPEIFDKNFSSLREIYESKNNKILDEAIMNKLEYEDMGRLLTLEARHSRRQRQVTLEKKKKPMPPDVVPYAGKQLEKLKANAKDKTGCVSNGSPVKTGQHNKFYEHIQPSDSASNSSKSESTDQTGVSDNHTKPEPSLPIEPFTHIEAVDVKENGLTTPSSQKSLNCSGDFQSSNSSQHDHSECNSESSTLKTSSTKFYYKANLYQHAKTNSLKQNEDSDKPEMLSPILNSDHNDLPVLIADTSAANLIKELASDTSTFSPSAALTPTKVFYVDVNTASNGMQIALSLKDRFKKSKDLRNAWKKFLNMASMKLHGTNKTDSKSELVITDSVLSSFAQSVDRDDGIASMNVCDENENVCSANTSSSFQILSRTSSSSSADVRSRQSRSEADYGYISGDSNESRAHTKTVYERFNFKANKSNPKGDHEHDVLKNITRMQEIKEISESERSSAPSDKDESLKLQKPRIVDYDLKKMMHTGAIEVNVYSSSDDERCSSRMSSDEECHLDLDEMCESGAESVETNSVFFKKIRKN